VIKNSPRTNSNQGVTSGDALGGCRGEEEEARKQQRKACVCLQVHQPDYKRLKNLCQIAKQCKMLHKYWGNAAFTVEIPENKSKQEEMTRYIQMVQTHGLVQLSLGAASINGVIDMDSKFLLQLMPEADGKQRDVTQTLVKDIFSMMEVNGRKVWICLARGSNRSYTGYFSSLMETINVHITNVVSCPGAQVYWWLRHRGCLAKDVNQMIRHCFMLDQQQKVIKLKYIANKGHAILNEADLDNIINAVAGADIYDTMLGLSDKEQRTAATSKGYDIMFGEAKEGAIEGPQLFFQSFRHYDPFQKHG
jgi:hypothetical protein